jgi:uncharacterized protein YaiL (DUF2058 family)
MSDSLRDQLLGLGFKPPAKPERMPAPQRPAPGRPADSRQATPPDTRRSDGRRPTQQRPQQARPHDRPRKPSQPNARPATGAAKPRSREDIDLAKAYAIRAQREKDERIEAERLKQEQARERREAKARLAELLKDKALNDPNADIARHFDYGGKIKRIHVTEAQFKALNAGELGVVQLDGRYVLVDAALLVQAEEIFLPAIALKVDPAASAEDPYADPRYQVPDDLVW